MVAWRREHTTHIIGTFPGILSTSTLAFPGFVDNRIMGRAGLRCVVGGAPVALAVERPRIGISPSRDAVPRDARGARDDHS